MRCLLRIERLEARMVLSATHAVMAAEPPDPELVQKAIVAGDPNGSPQDSPDLRVDPNFADSPFNGVGSLELFLGNDPDPFICSGTLISPSHVLTAGHCVDLDDNGVNDASSINFILNAGNVGDEPSHVIPAASDSDGNPVAHVHPDFTGFANPSVLDDLAIIELSVAVPSEANVTIYPISTDPFENIETVTLVGYGTSGDGVGGYYISPWYTVKRSGQNRTDIYLSDDEGSGAREGFQFDFDGDHRRTNIYGSPRDPSNRTLGNDIETTIGGGDSGGPSFLDDGHGNLTVFGVNTFTGGGGRAPAPYFGSVGGGIVVSAYQSWINGIIGGINLPPTANAGPDQNVTTESIVTLDGSGSSDPDGDTLSYSWTLDVPSGSSAVLSDPTAVNPTFTADVDGTYVATLEINDGNGNVDTDNVTINAAPAGTSMHVGDIDGTAPDKGRSGKWSANVTVTIHDNGENPVSGATVTGEWSGDASGTVTGVTDSLGNVSFSTGNMNSGSSVTFTVTDVSGSLMYNGTANHDDDEGSSNGTTITLTRGGSAVLARMNEPHFASHFSVVAVALGQATQDSYSSRDDDRISEGEVLLDAAREVVATFDQSDLGPTAEKAESSEVATRNQSINQRAIDEFLTTLAARSH